MRNKIFALFTLMMFCVFPLFAQEMPDDIKSELEAKAKALNPDNPSGEKTWFNRQKMAWESLANTTYSILAEDISLIKKLAEEKYPLDFAQQETFINDMVDKFKDIYDFEIVLGDHFKEFKKDAFKKYENDIDKILRHFEEQCMAKSEIDNFALPEGVDEDTFKITKEVVAAKMKGNYVAQLDAIKKQFLKGSVKQEESSESVVLAPVATGTTALISNAKSAYMKNTLLLEGSFPSTVFVLEIQSKMVVIIPTTSYTPGVPLSIINSMGEKLEYSPNNVYISKTLPFVMIIPDVMPTGTEPVKIAPPNEYRNKVGKTLFFVGDQGKSLYCIPTKLNTVSDAILTTSTNCPGNLFEGSLFVDGETLEVLGSMLSVKKPIPLADWFTLQNAQSFQRSFNHATSKIGLKSLGAVRIDKLPSSGWEKIDDAKIIEERKMIERLIEVIRDANFFFVERNMANMVERKALGGLFKKHYDILKARTEVSRFDKIYRQFLDAFVGTLKNEIRNVDLNKVSAANRMEVNLYIDIIKNIVSWIDNAKRTNGYKAYKEDLKQIQGIR